MHRDAYEDERVGTSSGRQPSFSGWNARRSSPEDEGNARLRLCKLCRRKIQNHSWKKHVQGKPHQERVALNESPPRVRCRDCSTEFPYGRHSCSAQSQTVNCCVCRLIIPLTQWNEHLENISHRKRWAWYVNCTQELVCNECDMMVLPVLRRNHAKMHEDELNGKLRHNGAMNNIHRKHRPRHDEQQPKFNTPTELPNFATNTATTMDWTTVPELGSRKSTTRNDGRYCIECNFSVPAVDRENHYLSRRHISTISFLNAPPRVNCRACGENDFALTVEHECEEKNQTVHCRFCDRNVPRSNWMNHVLDSVHFDRLKNFASETKRCETCDVSVVSVLWKDHVKHFRHPEQGEVRHNWLRNASGVYVLAHT